MKISIVQMDIVHKDPAANRQKIITLFAQAMLEKPDIIVFPETVTTGFCAEVFNEIRKFAETNDGATLTLFKSLAKKNNVYIVTGSIPELKADGEVYNTVFMLDKKGEIINSYSKIHLWPHEPKEAQTFTYGKTANVVTTEFGKTAMMICYDIRFSELAKLYWKKGAEVIFVVANFGDPKVEQWHTLLIAKAIETQAFVIACNRSGGNSEGTCFGASLIIDPMGVVIGEAGREEEILSGEIIVEAARKVRRELDITPARKATLYLELGLCD